jgi:hypothetical protein
MCALLKDEGNCSGGSSQLGAMLCVRDSGARARRLTTMVACRARGGGAATPSENTCGAAASIEHTGKEKRAMYWIRRRLWGKLNVAVGGHLTDIDAC